MATCFSSDPFAKIKNEQLHFDLQAQPRWDSCWACSVVSPFKNIVFGNMNVFNTQGAAHSKEFQAKIYQTGKSLQSYFSLLGSK